jgi:hypothetical protein
MTIPHFFSELWTDAARARAFISSPDSTVLHEAAHFCAANEDRPIAGQLIFASVGTSGAFMPDTRDSATWNSNSRQFTIAAAMVAELHFCNITDARRALADLNQYNGDPILQDREDEELRTAVALWRSKYLGRVRALEDRIAATYESCRQAISSNRYLIGTYHVIPSSSLPSAFADPRFADHHHWRTASYRARWLALEEFLRNLQNPPLSKFERLKGWVRTWITP